jgi:TonB-dependent starch-binding outer membrane protein SusC
MSLAPRAAVSCFVLAVLISGCASGNRALPDPTAKANPRSPDGTTIVTSDDLDRIAREPIEQTLAAKVPGLVISHRPDGTIEIRIRGRTSIVGSSEPLYIIDGVPVLAGPGGGLSGINPRDIASIEVLKDAASTAFYGLRGANGVIVIRTKQYGQ